jgi:hypothetical protein
MMKIVKLLISVIFAIALTLPVLIVVFSLYFLWEYIYQGFLAGRYVQRVITDWLIDA